jgi:hypothetical protein
MSNSVNTALKPVIEPVYDDSIDLTSSWADRKHADIFPAVYRRWRAPVSVEECGEMIEDLAAIIVAINDQYDDARRQAFTLGLNPNSDTPTKDKLKSIRSARNRYEAVRRAYIHWLSCETGQPSGLIETGRTQYSSKVRTEALAAAVKKLLEIYIQDLTGHSDNTAMLEELKLLQKQLEAVFVG